MFFMRKGLKVTQPMREYCQHCSIDARRIASKTYQIFDRDWFSIDGPMDGAAAASASSAASKVLIARLCIEDELKRQHRPPSLPFPSSPFSTETKAGRGNRRTWCKILLLFPRPISNGSSGPQQAYVVVLSQLFTVSIKTKAMSSEEALCK